jgi:catechol 2,3-dioxygenase-like lactoylglutathione lyase family enzyme
MTVQLNHTIVPARDKEKSARFMADLLGLPAPLRFGPFYVVQLANGVSLDFIDDTGDLRAQHYAFLLTEPEFDVVFARIVEWGLAYWADPAAKLSGQINHHYGGRGVYFEDPDGHYLEIITRPYGSEP